MYKIIENNQIIDVIKDIKFVKYLPQSGRMISVDERQANGCLSSNENEVYHIFGRPNPFNEYKRTVKYIAINEQEYNELTTQLKENQELINKVYYLE
jgi:hypothetical protein